MITTQHPACTSCWTWGGSSGEGKQGFGTPLRDTSPQGTAGVREGLRPCNSLWTMILSLPGCKTHLHIQHPESQPEHPRPPQAVSRVMGQMWTELRHLPEGVSPAQHQLGALEGTLEYVLKPELPREERGWVLTGILQGPQAGGLETPNSLQVGGVWGFCCTNVVGTALIPHPSHHPSLLSPTPCLLFLFSLTEANCLSHQHGPGAFERFMHEANYAPLIWKPAALPLTFI